MDQFHNFDELRQHAREQQDYIVEVRKGKSGIAIMAPHGGAIEPGTAAIADAIAGSEHSYYAFKGLLPGHNNKLHIASVRFDEPRAMALVHESHTIVTVHGCRGTTSLVYVGGKDVMLKQGIIDALLQAGIPAEISPGPLMRGIHPNNLCNRGSRGRGVQLEITSALRRRMMSFKGIHQTSDYTPLYGTLVDAVRVALNDACTGGLDNSPAYSFSSP